MNESTEIESRRDCIILSNMQDICESTSSVKPSISQASSRIDCDAKAWSISTYCILLVIGICFLALIFLIWIVYCLWLIFFLKCKYRLNRALSVDVYFIFAKLSSSLMSASFSFAGLRLALSSLNPSQPTTTHHPPPVKVFVKSILW